ncbi:hypothetical protein, partial [Pseudonocardia sp. N23]|uniref:hypothetical protein n=1 Tax=Pseudonocardia sp. N23 TaxID=1987376 RepID=UPI001145A9BC
HADALLTEARLYSSPKYEALALAALGRPEDAALVAARTRSDLVIGQLGTPAQRSAALGRIAQSLPVELRERFGSTGRLVSDRPRTS